MTLAYKYHIGLLPVDVIMIDIAMTQHVALVVLHSTLVCDKSISYSWLSRLNFLGSKRPSKYS